MIAQETDIAVIGGGPAGSTVATLLCNKGWRVALFEKEEHPRFHIGESLLPRNMPILRRLGVYDDISLLGVVKHAAEFYCHETNANVIYDFGNALAPDEPTAFQVTRSQFDNLLIQNAEKSGVELHQRTMVNNVDITNPSGAIIYASSEDGTEVTYSAKFVVDASGRDTFLAKKMNQKERLKSHDSAAIFAHFNGVPHADDAHGGNIGVYWFRSGWFWVIPLQDGRTSVGMVAWPNYMKSRESGIDLESFLKQGFDENPALRERMKSAEVIGEVMSTGNFSYVSNNMFGSNYLMIGDAFAFIDPVFSSGVFLAMQGAEYACETVDACLKNPKKTNQHLKKFERRIKRGIGVFSWFIHRFTSPAMRRMFLHPTKHFGIVQAVISVLSGDVHGRTRVWPQIVAFRTFYYLFSILEWSEGKCFRDRFRKL